MGFDRVPCKIQFEPVFLPFRAKNIHQLGVRRDDVPRQLPGYGDCHKHIGWGPDGYLNPVPLDEIKAEPLDQVHEKLHDLELVAHDVRQVLRDRDHQFNFLLEQCVPDRACFVQLVQHISEVQDGFVRQSGFILDLEEVEQIFDELDEPVCFGGNDVMKLSLLIFPGAVFPEEAVDGPFDRIQRGPELVRIPGEKFVLQDLRIDQLFVRPGKLGGFRLQLIQKEDILQRKRCMVRNNLHQVELFFEERAAVFLIIDVQDPEQFIPAQDGAGDKRGGPVMTPLHVLEARVGVDILDEYRNPVLRNDPRDPFSELDLVALDGQIQSPCRQYVKTVPVVEQHQRACFCIQMGYGEVQHDVRDGADVVDLHQRPGDVLKHGIFVLE